MAIGAESTLGERVGPASVAMLALALLASSASAADVNEVLAGMRKALYPAPTMRAESEVRLLNRLGEEVRWTGHYARSGGQPKRLRLDFESPPDLRGVTLVVEQRARDLDLFEITLPSIRRTRVIVRNLRGESFLGTDFNYEDLGFERLDYQEHRLEGEETMEGRTCWKIASIPSDTWWYGRIVRWIDQQSSLPVRTDYFDPAGLLFKRRTLGRIETVDGHPTPHEITMETLPAHTKTVLELKNVEYGADLGPSTFAIGD